MKPNQSVEMIVEFGKHAGEYLSKVTEIKGEQIKVTLPIKKENVVPLPVGTKLKVIYTDEKAKYEFETKIVSRQLEGNIATCSLTQPKEVYKIQRRDFVRVPIRLGVEYRKLNLEEEEREKLLAGEEIIYDEDKQEDFKKGLTDDISGGGLLLVVKEFIPLDSIMELRLDVDKLDFETVLGRVLRLDDFPDRKNKLGLGIRFINISRSQQDDIVAWVLQRQLDLHRKGLL